MAEPSTKNIGISIPTGLSGPAFHAFDRSANSHRKTSSPSLTTYETHTVAYQKQLEGTGITRKGHSNSLFLAPPSKVVACRKQYASRLTITSTRTCSSDLYRCIKRRVGRSLKRTHCMRNFVPSRSKLHKLFRTKSDIFSLERVPRPLTR